jgi:putative aldouronate transport system substrate-binding protein
MALAGCGGGKEEGKRNTEATKSQEAQATPSAEPTASPSEPKKKIVELHYYAPGDTPQGMQKVLDAVNSKLEQDNVGVKLNLHFVPWSDYGNKTSLMISAGDDFDAYLDAPWLHMNQMIASGAIIPLDDYISPEKTPNLWKAIPEKMWETNKFNGKIMGIPLGVTQGNVRGFVVRQDLREKYGLPEIKTMEDFIKFLYEVKKNEKGITPFGLNGSSVGVLPGYFNAAYWQGQSLRYELGVNWLYGTPEGTVKSIMTEPPADEMASLETMSKLYKDGIFDKNIAQEQNADPLFNQGKFAATIYAGDGVQGMKFLEALKLPGAKLEVVVPFETNAPKLISDFKQWNFTAINMKSKHAEQVIALMEWLSIKENHDLLEYGIEGENWKAVGDDQYEQISANPYSFPAFVMTWRPTLARTSTSMLPGDKTWFDFCRNPDNFTPSPFIGFVANTEPVKTQFAKVDPLMGQYYSPMSSGILDPAKGFPELKVASEKAGIQKVIVEVQSQLDAFRKK